MGLLHKLRQRLSRRACPFCGWAGLRFNDSQTATPRPDVQCPRCRSLERHRLAFLLMDEKIAPGQQTLHVSPEPSIRDWLKHKSQRYIDIDLDPRLASRAMDLTNLEFPPDTFSLVWCSHVLEHIPDDRKAMSEMHRVMKPDGLTVIQVPVFDAPTYEDWSITDPQERRRAFGQEDHVRKYGPDLKQRLDSVGFVTEVLSADSLPPETVERYRPKGVHTCELFVCKKS